MSESSSAGSLKSLLVIGTLLLGAATAGLNEWRLRLECESERDDLVARLTGFRRQARGAGSTGVASDLEVQQAIERGMAYPRLLRRFEEVADAVGIPGFEGLPVKADIQKETEFLIEKVEERRKRLLAAMGKEGATGGSGDEEGVKLKGVPAPHLMRVIRMRLLPLLEEAIAAVEEGAKGEGR